MIDPFVKKGLEKLMDPTGSFSICKFDDICQVLNVIPPKGHRDRLSLVHCVSYRDMDNDLRQEVGRLVYETLQSPGFDIQLKPAQLESGKVLAITGKRSKSSD